MFCRIDLSRIRRCPIPRNWITILRRKRTVESDSSFWSNGRNGNLLSFHASCTVEGNGHHEPAKSKKSDKVPANTISVAGDTRRDPGEWVIEIRLLIEVKCNLLSINIAVIVIGKRERRKLRNCWRKQMLKQKRSSWSHTSRSGDTRSGSRLELDVFDVREWYQQNPLKWTCRL